MAVSSMQLVDNISVTSTTALVYSQAVNMNGANAVQITYVVSSGTVALTISLEGSNDLSNWAAISSFAATTTPFTGFFAPAAQGSIAYQYVRLKFSASSTTIVSVWLATAFL